MPSETSSRPRSVVVTGAGGGLGSEIARHFAADGASVACIDLPDSDIDGVAGTVDGLGGRGLAVGTDLSDPAAISAMIDTVVDHFEGIDVVVNNAASYLMQPWTDITVERWDHTLAVNLRAYFLCAQRAHPHLAASPHGRIVNVASSTFFTGWSGLLDYVSSKGGIVGFTRSLAREIGPDGITVNCVSPGAIPTAAESHHDDQDAFNEEILDKQSVKRRGSPADIAHAVAFFASPDSGFVSGQTLEVDGGWVMH